MRTLRSRSTASTSLPWIIMTRRSRITADGPIGALNRELEVRMGQRDRGPISFKERGPSINAVTNVLSPAGRMPPPPEARTVDSDLDSEDEFDDGADWLNGPAALSEFKTAEKDLFVLAASSGIDLRAPYLRELLDSIGKQPLHPGSAPTKKAAAKNLSLSVPDPSAWDEWK
ncbi:hypothetical protein F4604DRAFT_601672 [Suillus subluteus]|nr:hypothetical protein F4604DRAFT_601672 [Suillus subluteus]